MNKTTELTNQINLDKEEFLSELNNLSISKRTDEYLGVSILTLTKVDLVNLLKEDSEFKSQLNNSEKELISMYIVEDSLKLRNYYLKTSKKLEIEEVEE